jgi:Tfp pilus assembly protein PilE
MTLRKAFAQIELLAALAIFAILVGMALSQFEIARARTQLARAQAELREIDVAARARLAPFWDQQSASQSEIETRLRTRVSIEELAAKHRFVDAASRRVAAELSASLSALAPGQVAGAVMMSGSPAPWTDSPALIHADFRR